MGTNLLKTEFASANNGVLLTNTPRLKVTFRLEMDFLRHELLRPMGF